MKEHGEEDRTLPNKGKVVPDCGAVARSTLSLAQRPLGRPHPRLGDGGDLDRAALVGVRDVDRAVLGLRHGRVGVAVAARRADPSRAQLALRRCLCGERARRVLLQQPLVGISLDGAAAGLLGGFFEESTDTRVAFGPSVVVTPSAAEAPVNRPGKVRS